jgi:hypothetical protein
VGHRHPNANGGPSPEKPCSRSGRRPGNGLGGLTCVPVRRNTLFVARGAVVVTIRGCDYYAVSSPLGYAILEWYGGGLPAKGDVIVGTFEQYGFQDLYNVTQDQETRVWVEDYWLSAEEAAEKLAENCD